MTDDDANDLGVVKAAEKWLEDTAGAGAQPAIEEGRKVVQALLDELAAAER